MHGRFGEEKRKQEGLPDYEPICGCGKNVQEHTFDEVLACLGKGDIQKDRQ